MRKEQFYKGRSITTIEWWLHDCQLPELMWARLRVFDDGTADACFGEGETIYGFAERQYAGFFLAEDEYITLAGLDREYGFRVADITPPTWADREDQEFRYLGIY